MKKSIFSFFMIVLSVSLSASVFAGMHFGMVEAVKDKVKELDAKAASGTARFVVGATNAVPGTMSQTAKKAFPRAAALAQGNWVITPNKVRARVGSLRFQHAGGAISNAVLKGSCVFTYDRSLASKSTLLDCPFEVAPGDYIGMTIGLDDDYEILVNDTDNGIFSDPTSTTGLTSTQPVGGGQFITTTVNNGGGGVFFETTLHLGGGGAVPVIRIVTDAIHTFGMFVENDGTLTPGTLAPLRVVPFTTNLPRVAVYTSTTSAAWNFENPGDVNSAYQTMQLFYASDGQPFVAWFGTGPWPGISACSTQGLGTSTSYHNGSSLSAPTIGLYLGRDSGGTIAGVTRRTDGTFGQIFSFDEQTLTNSTTIFNYKCESNPPSPTSGSNYSSGAPTFTPDGQVPLTLFVN